MGSLEVRTTWRNQIAPGEASFVLTTLIFAGNYEMHCFLRNQPSVASTYDWPQKNGTLVGGWSQHNMFFIDCPSSVEYS